MSKLDDLDDGIGLIGGRGREAGFGGSCGPFECVNVAADGPDGGGVDVSEGDVIDFEQAGDGTRAAD